MVVAREEGAMPRYMIQFAYTAEAWAALLKNPQDRREPFLALAEALGARLLSLDYCFGEYDGVVLLEAPEDTTATAIVVAAVAPWHVRATRTTKLMTVEETLEALRKAGTQAYPVPRASG